VMLNELLLLVGRAGRPWKAEERLFGRHYCKHLLLIYLETQVRLL
jgi:hypothetical protein